MWTGIGIIALIAIVVVCFAKKIFQYISYSIATSSARRAAAKERSQQSGEAEQSLKAAESDTVMSPEYRSEKLNETPEPVYLFNYIRDFNSFDDDWFKYIGTITTLVNQYLYFGEQEKTRTAFIWLLNDDPELLERFVRECHAAVCWRKEHGSVYDCDNYMQDFISENHIEERLKERNPDEDIIIPEKLSHYCKDTQSPLGLEVVTKQLKLLELQKSAPDKADTSFIETCLGAIAAVIGAVLFLATVAGGGSLPGLLLAAIAFAGTAVLFTKASNNRYEANEYPEVVQKEVNEAKEAIRKMADSEGRKASLETSRYIITVWVSGVRDYVYKNDKSRSVSPKRIDDERTALYYHETERENQRRRY